MAKLAEDPPEVRAAAQAAVDAPRGVGSIASYWTEVPLPATGTWNAPGKGGAQADLVLAAPQDQVPLLFIQVDNCHETAEELADKLEKYGRFFRRKVKDTDGKERPMWRTRWNAPDTWSGDRPHPPVLLVFNRIGERNPNRTIEGLPHLRREDPDHRDRPDEPARARRGGAGVPSLRPRLHAAPAGSDRQSPS
ncbi:hypothetical protein ABZX62_26690 [Streptomyces flavidovirens]|uniref:hypothetical protein n=1 Tax=Streptomyces flavidovirens TaxID=67298 RepID=UPI0033A0D8EE